MPFTLTPVASLDLNNKEIKSLHLINSNEALVGAIQGGFWRVTDIANNVATQASGTGSDFVYGIGLDGQYAFTFSFDGATTIRSRNLSDFDTSIDSKVISPNEDVYGIAAQNGYVYAVSSNKLRIYSHVNGVMTLQNTVTIATDGFSKLFKMIGDFLYFSNNSEFRIYSIAADPTVPVLKAEMSDLAPRPDIQVSGNYLYMLHYDGNMVTVRDITTIINDSGSFPLNGAGFPIVNEFATQGNAQKMAVNGNTLFAANPNPPTAYKVASYDISNPLSVADLGVVDITFSRDHITGGPQINVMDSISDRLFIGMNDFTFGPKRLRTYTFSLTPTPPSFDVQPQTQSVNNGASVTLSVTVSGTVPLTYQWKKNGVNISGATSSSYNIPVVDTTHAGSYTVFVSNEAGNATSNPAVLTVKTVPEIEIQPSSQDLNTGNSVNFGVSAVGGIPLTYQWKKNGVNILGANSSTYGIPSVIPTDSATYTVVVANSFGSVVSDGAILTVSPIPGSMTTLSDTFPNAGNNFKTVVSGTKAFLMGDFTGLTVLDVSNPSNPVVLDTKFYSPGGPTWDMVLIGNYLYLTWGAQIISVFVGDILSDVSSTLPSLPTGTFAGSFKWLVTDGTSLYAGRETGSPRQVYKITPVNGNMIATDWIVNLGSDASIAATMSGNGNFLIVMCTGDLWSIHKTTGGIANQLSQPNQFLNGTDIAAYGNAIYLSKGGGFISLFGISNIGVLNAVGSGSYGSTIANPVRTLTVKEHFLYASDDSGKMFVFDVTNAQTPLFFASSSAFPERFRKPAINDNHKVFATTFSNPSRLVVLGFNTAPIITSTAPIEGTPGVQYVYNPTVMDNENNVDVWELIDSPVGMSVNPSSGQVTWTPSIGTLTSGTFYLKVTDTSGLIDVEQITIYVSQGIEFIPGTPVTSEPTPSGSTLTLPADCYDTPETLTFTELPLDDRDAANIKFLDYGFQITTTGSTTFDNPVILTIHYTDAQLVAAGITKENKLKISFFNTTNNRWVNLPTNVDTVNNIATAELPHLTDFGFGESSTTVAEVGTEINGQPVIVLKYMRDTQETDSNMFYVFVDENNNLVISKKPVHSSGSDILGENSVVE